MEMEVFVDGKPCLISAARKKAVFMAEKMFPISAAKIKAVFMDGKVADKKETPSKGCLRNVFCNRPFAALRMTECAQDDSLQLFVKRSSNVNSASNCTTYHRVVTDSEESHHLNVCWN